MYYYTTMNDVVTTHSGVIEREGFDYIDVHFERPNKKGFDFLDVSLPGAIVSKSFGFSEDEIMDLQSYARDNEPLIWDFARNGGGAVA